MIKDMLEKDIPIEHILMLKLLKPEHELEVSYIQIVGDFELGHAEQT